MKCPQCGSDAHAEFVDVGIGMCQVGPYHCICGWVERGCPAKECDENKCTSWSYCQGKSILPEQNCGNCKHNDGYECAVQIQSLDISACEWEPISDLI